jgi:hypothetical protein
MFAAMATIAMMAGHANMAVRAIEWFPSVLEKTPRRFDKLAG